MKIRNDVKDIIESKNISNGEYYFTHITAPPLYSFISPIAIEYLNYLATSIKLSSKIHYKYDQIEKTVEPFGFVRMGRGTNRVVFRHLEDPRYVLKVAVDDVGRRDNPREFINQDYLYPFVAKVFEVDPTGTVALVERIVPITHRDEFASVANKIFKLLRFWFTGRYIMEDIGSEYFMNWGIRNADGCPVLCDYPYLYELDYNKIKCTRPNDYGVICNGIIDYDEGYNRLVCTKCGAKYRAVELAKAISKNEAQIDKGDKSMLSNQKLVVTIRRNGVTKKIDTQRSSKSIIEQRYDDAEASVKKSAYAIKARLNNIIMDESTPIVNDQAAKLKKAIEATKKQRNSVTQNVGEVIDKAVEKAKPVEEAPKPVVTREPMVEDYLAEGKGDRYPKKKSSKKDNRKKDKYKNKVMEDNEPDYIPEENNTTSTANDVAAAMRQNIMATIEHEEAAPVSDESTEEVTDNSVEESMVEDAAVKEEHVEEPEVQEEEVSEDNQVDEVEEHVESDSTESEDEYDEESEDEDTVEKEEAIEDLTISNVWNVQNNFIPEEEEEDDIFDVAFHKVEIYGIPGVLIDNYHCDELELPDGLWAYDLQGYDDNQVKPRYITDKHIDNAWVGTVILSAYINFEDVDNGLLEISQDPDSEEALKVFEETIFLSEYIEAVLNNGDNDDYEMVDAPVGVAAVTTEGEH